jgi:CrcB protein
MMQISWMQIVLVGVGGMLGSILRFVTGTLMSRQFGNRIPLGTFTVNIVGSFLIGLILGYSIKRIAETGHLSAANWTLFFATGFCGGFTTFSAFCNEGFLLLKENQFSLFFVYFTASVVLGLLATAAGYFLTK